MRKFRTPLLVATALSLLITASSAIAGNGNQRSSSSITLVQLSSARTAESGPVYGDQVTFDVSTATDRPYVLLNCYRSGEWVYAAQAGFWASYPSKTFTLAAASWGGGPADCTARLGSLNNDGTRFRELASTSFSVTG